MTKATLSKSDQADLNRIARRYRSAAGTFGRQFVAFIQKAGPLLDQAHAMHCNRRGASWEYFCENHLRCTKRYADRLRAAYATIQRLESAGHTNLPAAETTCRLLGKIAADDQPAAWQCVLDAKDRPTTEDVREALVADKRFASAFPARANKSDDAEASPGDDAIRDALTRTLADLKLSAAARRRLMAATLGDLVA